MRCNDISRPCETYCLVSLGSICWKLHFWFRSAFCQSTESMPGFQTRRTGDRKKGFLHHHHYFCSNIGRTFQRLPQKGPSVGCFHAYEFNSASSLKFYSKVPCRHHLVTVVNRDCALGGRWCYCMCRCKYSIYVRRSLVGREDCFRTAHKAWKIAWASHWHNL